MRRCLLRLLTLLLLLLAGLSLLACTSILREGRPAGQNESQDGPAVEEANLDSQQTDQRPVESNQPPAGTIEGQPEPPPVEPSPTPVQISGYVIDSRTGDPLSATIHVGNRRVASAQIASRVTDSNGFFQVGAVELPITIQVEVPGYELWETQLDAVETLVAETGSALEISLIPHVTRGVISAADTNAPLSGVLVTVNSSNGQQIVTTDDAGAFELYSLLPNDRLEISAPSGYLSDEVIFADAANLNLVLQPRRVVVSVRDGFTGEPVVDSQVTLNEKGGGSTKVTGRTDAQGETTLSLLPEAGQVFISSPGYITATVDYEASQTVAVTLAPASLQGVVRGADTGRPLPRSTIYWGDTFFHTDENGHFVLETLPITPTQMMIKAAGYHRTYAQLSQTGVITGYESPFSGAEGRWLASTACTQTSQPVRSPCLDLTLEPFQAKAIYIPLHYLRSRQRMIGYLDFIAATELNAIVVDVKGDFGFVAWDSQVDLVAEVGADEWFTDTWMPLDEFIAEARARNIYTIARLVVFKDDPLSHGKPEWAAVTEDGTVWIDREELGWVNPFREEVWQYNIELAKEVAEFGFDELNFDYIRFPSDGNVAAIVYEQENSVETRTGAIRQFMTRLSESLQPYGVFISADVFGLTIWVVPTSDMRIGQRIIDVAPQVDYLAPMVYPSTFIPGNLGYDDPSAEPYGIVYRSQQEAETLVPPYVKVRPWLQGYWYSLEEMQQLKQAAIDSESAGWSWWNAGGKYDIDLFEPAEGQE